MKTRNRLLAALLTLVLALTMLPISALAENEPPAAGKVEIDPESCDFDPAEHGYGTISPKPLTLRNGTSRSVTVKSLDGLTAFEATPLNVAAQPVSLPFTLPAGESMNIAVNPKSGLAAGEYNETLTIAYNDGTDKTLSIPLRFSVTDGSSTPQTISEIRVEGFEAPIAGEKAGDHLNLTVAPGCHYTIVNKWWFDNSQLRVLRADEEFVAGVDYVCHVLVETDTGYRFDNNVEFYANGSQDLVNTSNSFLIGGYDNTHGWLELRAQTAVQQYTVSVQADPDEGGTVSGDGTVTAGQSATVTATANPGYAFDGWYEGTTERSKDASYTFTPTADVTLTARFIQTYPVWIGDRQANEKNKDDILNDGGKAKYDPATRTLTLNDPAISTFGPNGAVIEAENIDLTVTGSATLNVAGAAYGLAVWGGTLDLRANLSATGEGSGVFVPTNSLSISGTVTATATGTNVMGAIYTEGSLSISGDVTAMAVKPGLNFGVNARAGLSISSGSLDARGNYMGISTGGRIEIGDGVSRVYAAGNYCGIDAGSSEISLGGQLSIVQPSDGMLSADKHTIVSAAMPAKAAQIVEIIPGSCTVRFMDGSVELFTQTVRYGAKATWPDPAPQKDGFQFVNWYADDAWTTLFDFDRPITADTQIYGQFVRMWNVTIDMNGGTIKDFNTGMIQAAISAELPEGYGQEIPTVEWMNEAIADGSWITAPANSEYIGAQITDATGTKTCQPGELYTLSSHATIKVLWKSTAPAPVISYAVTSGADSTWTKGSSTGVTVTVKRSEDDANCIKYFDSVEIDGATLAASDYEAVSGSTVVTIKAAALQKLTDGKHTITVKFKDGEVSTSVTVKAASGGTGKPSTPKTGDESNPALYIALIVLSLTGTVCVVSYGKSRKQRGY